MSTKVDDGGGDGNQLNQLNQLINQLDTKAKAKSERSARY